MHDFYTESCLNCLDVGVLARIDGFSLKCRGGEPRDILNTGTINSVLKRPCREKRKLYDKPMTREILTMIPGPNMTAKQGSFRKNNVLGMERQGHR